jgi:hypothetical protein
MRTLHVIPAKAGIPAQDIAAIHDGAPAFAGATGL